MKSFLILLVLSASAVHAQSSPRVSLELGTATVWLGMDKAAAKQAIEASGMVFPDKGGADSQVIATDLRSKRIYTLKFQNNKLIFADRNWLDETNAMRFR